MIKGIRLSIIIVSYNVKDLLKKCLQSIEQTVKQIEYEVIVVDNCSVDGSVAMIKAEFPKVKIIENEENRGFAAANNQGINCSQGDYILLLNPDTIVLSNSINRMLEFIANHQQVGIVGCKILNPDGTIQPSCNHFPNLWDYVWESFFIYKFVPTSKIIGRFHMTYFNYNKVKEVDCVKGAFLTIKKEVISDIKGFDEDFFFYSEEFDLCYRAKQKGWKIIFYPDAEIIHYGGQSTLIESEALFIELHKGRYLFMLKHHPFWKAFLVKILLFIGVVIRTVVWFVSLTLLGKNNFREKRFRLFWNTFKWYLHKKVQRINSKAF